MIQCSACGTPLCDINEPCPNCLPGMAWRPPTRVANKANTPDREHPATNKGKSFNDFWREYKAHRRAHPGR